MEDKKMGNLDINPVEGSGTCLQIQVGTPKITIRWDVPMR